MELGHVHGALLVSLAEGVVVDFAVLLVLETAEVGFGELGPDDLGLNLALGLRKLVIKLRRGTLNSSSMPSWPPPCYSSNCCCWPSIPS